MTVWIAIPVFNEAGTVGEVVRAARRHAPVLVVDDGSSDDSGRVATAAGAEVIRHSRRLGKGPALRTALTAARHRGASHLVTLDGDGQHAPDDVPVLLAAARQAPGAIIVGTRVGSDGQAPGLPVDRLNAIRLAGFFVNWSSGLSLGDTQSGFRVYPVSALDGMALRRGGFVLETEALVTAATRGIPVHEVPITVIPRAARRSRFRPVADGVAIGSYLAGRTLRRWAAEARAAVVEVAAVLSRDRRRARHADMLQAGAARADSFAGWGVAISAVAASHASARLTYWWAHPRRRRATAAAGAILTLPVVLALTITQVVAGRFLPDLVTPLVDRVFSQARLGAAQPPGRPRQRPDGTGATVATLP
ncbi:MAG TPA: glycosyltransferase family 2 protein [Methylomirabilota bacterium]|nr:glycosyltransferase family 2 protein [Methylomirabilota bacterium]